MKSPDCKSCMYACKQACAKPCSTSPMMMGGQGNCKIIKRCTSPKPMPTPGCKWVKKCSPSMTALGFGGITTSPVIFGRRRYSPYWSRGHRRHHFSRRISPFATTAIGHRPYSPIRPRRSSISPIRRPIVSPARRPIVSPVRRPIVSPRRR